MSLSAQEARKSREFIVSAPQQAALSSRVRESLQARIECSEDLSQDEVAEIEGLSCRLFSKHFELDRRTSEQIRALCKLSQCELKDGRKISSHRRFIGAPIVAAKRILWKFNRALLEDSFVGLQEFCSCMVRSHGALIEKTANSGQDKSGSIPRPSFPS